MQLIRKTDDKDKFGRYIYIFQCPECNSNIKIDISNGKRNKTCGCKLLDHKEIKSKRLYFCWKNIHIRCKYKSYNRYNRYGGRGIKVCSEWSNYLIFQEWSLNNGYNNNLQIDRINNNGNYEPSNCRWVLPIINHRNSSNVKLNIGYIKSIKYKYKQGNTPLELSEQYNITRRQVYNILNNKHWQTITTD